MTPRKTEVVPTRDGPMPRRIANAWAKDIERKFGHRLRSLKLVQVAGEGTEAPDEWIIISQDNRGHTAALVSPADCDRLQRHLRKVQESGR